MKTKLFFLVGLTMSLVAFTKVDEVRKQAALWFKQMNEAYNKQQGLSFDMEYRIYKGHTSQTIHESRTAHVKRMGKTHFKQIIDGIETIQNHEVLLVKDDSTQMILIKNPVDVKQLEAGLNIEKALKVASQIEPIKNKDQNGYKLIFDSKTGMEFKQLNMVVNTETGLLDEMEVWYVTKVNFGTDMDKNEDMQPAHMKMTMTKVSTKAVSEAEFSTEKYLTKTSKGWVVKAQYKKYRFIDQTTTNNTK